MSSLPQHPQLTRFERFQIQGIHASFDRPGVDRVIRWCQRTLGASWVTACTRNLLRIHGAERLPPLDPAQSFLCVSNHRSFFDLYVLTAYLFQQGMTHRLVFPVRSTFFYDHPLGPLVNGAMSFFAMYPPMFRERKRAALNVESLDEVVHLLSRGGVFVGLHPEGKRNLSDDPYTLLPAQSGVGKILHRTRVPVLPVFLHGLSNSLGKQMAGNFNGKGDPITIVFGKPVDFGDRLQEPGSPRLYQKLAAHAMEAIQTLADEARLLHTH